MTSPYLNRPPRRIDEALRDRGLSRKDIGLPGENGESTLPPTMRARRRRRYGAVRYLVVAVLAGMVALGLAAVFLDDEQKVAQDEAESLSDIAPAAGPSAPSKEEPANSGLQNSLDELGPAPSLTTD